MLADLSEKQAQELRRSLTACRAGLTNHLAH
jgi:hypothetical protein